MNRTLSRRIGRLETRAAATTHSIECRIRFIDPVEGLTRVLVFDASGSREDPVTPEEREQVRADLEARRAKWENVPRA